MNPIVTEAMVCSSNINSSYIRKLKKKKKKHVRSSPWPPASCCVTSASVKDADASISAIVDLISSQCGVAVCLDPHSCHGIIKDLVVLNEAQTC